jgi:O-antigen/teichoic acid export membrane protein
MKILKNPIFKNYTSLSLNHGVIILLNILFVPLFLTFWDVSTYADWILISTIPAILTLGELGLTSYGSNLIVILYNQKKKKKVNYTFQNIIFFSTTIILSLGLVLIFLNYVFNFKSILNINSLDKFEFYIILIFFILKYLLITNFNFISSIFRINNQFHLSVYMQTFFIFSEIIFVSITLYLGGKILEVSAIGFINYVIAFIFSYYLVKKEFLWIKIINFKNINFLFLKKIFYPSVSFMTVNLCKMILINGTIILLKVFSNELILILYNSLRLIMNGSRQLINILTISFQNQITIDYAKNNLSKIVNKFRILSKYNFLSSTIIAIIFIIFLEKPFLIWTMDNVDWNFNFFILFLLASYFDWLAIPILTIPYSLNKAEVYNKVFVSSLMIYFIILISIFEYQNLIAVPISLIIANLFTYIYSYIKLNKIFFLKNHLIN